MSEPQVSVIIPTQNMSGHLEPLLESLRTSGTDKFTNEVIVVNDGSTDETDQLLETKRQDSFWKDRLKVLKNWPANGRFQTRRLGAQAAQGPLLLFLDTRVVLASGQGQRLEKLLQTQSHLMGMPEIDETKSLFNLYWKRSHQLIFRKHFRDVEKGFFLTVDNYEEYAKGTGMLLVPRQDFLKACEALNTGDIKADDTLLIREIATSHPIFVSKELSFDWEPRQRWSEFLWRLVDRGPGFVQYHFLAERTPFFYAFLISLIFSVLILSGSWIFFLSLWPGLFSLLGLGAFSVFLMTRNPFEAIRLLPLHILVLLSFTVGIAYGMSYCAIHRKSKGVSA